MNLTFADSALAFKWSTYCFQLEGHDLSVDTRSSTSDAMTNIDGAKFTTTNSISYVLKENKYKHQNIVL